MANLGAFDPEYVASGLFDPMLAPEGFYDYGAFSNWNTSTQEPQAVVMSASGNIAAAAATSTTFQLTPPAGKTSADFFAGRISDDTNPLPSLDPGADDYIEVEFCVKAVGGIALPGDVIKFRLTKNGAPLDTYTLTPQLTIASAALVIAPLDQDLPALARRGRRRVALASIADDIYPAAAAPPPTAIGEPVFDSPARPWPKKTIYVPV